MTSKNLPYRLSHLLSAGALAVLIALPQAGCARREVEIEGQGQDVEIKQEPGGEAEVEVEPESQAEQDLERLGAEAQQAGREAGAAAREAGRDFAAGAREAGQALEQGAREVGERVRPAAREAGEAFEEGARRVGEQVEPVLSDAAITAKVKAKLLADPQIQAFHIDVDTVNGVVTLNGEVASNAAKQEAEKLARLTEGVKQVNNVIQIAGQPVPPPPAGSR